MATQAKVYVLCCNENPRDVYESYGDACADRDRLTNPAAKQFFSVVEVPLIRARPIVYPDLAPARR